MRLLEENSSFDFPGLVPGRARHFDGQSYRLRAVEFPRRFWDPGLRPRGCRLPGLARPQVGCQTPGLAQEALTRPIAGPISGRLAPKILVTFCALPML